VRLWKTIVVGAASLTACAAMTTTATATTAVNELGLTSAQAAQLQAEVDKTLAAAPGGVQISPYEVTWNKDNGKVLMSFPLPGQKSAPPASSATAGKAGVVDGEMGTQGDRHGCPYGVFDKWYCFYENSQFGGRRLQFLYYYCPSDPNDPKTLEFNDYSFGNMTSSWVNNSKRTIKVYDGPHAVYLLWTEGAESEGPELGGLNDRAHSATIC
jgi:hypothetical protein